MLEVHNLKNILKAMKDAIKNIKLLIGINKFMKKKLPLNSKNNKQIKV